MASPARIKTPLKQHLHRFRLGALPLLAFFFSVIVTLWLWQRQGNTGALVGEVEALQVEVPAPVGGTIVDNGSGNWQLFSAVKKGQVIAQLDDKHLQAELAAVNAEVQRLTAEIEAAQANLELQQFDVDQAQLQTLSRLELQLQQLRLDAIQRESEYAIALKEYEIAEAALQSLQKLNQQSGLVLPDRLQVAIDTRELTLRKSRAAAKVWNSTKTERDQLASQVQDSKAVPLPDVVERVMRPIQAAVTVQEAQLRRITAQLEDIVITAPADGIITAVHFWPGQFVPQGSSVMTLARPDSSYVISYVRERSSVKPYEGMRVALKLRDEPAKEYFSQVETVGPHVQAVPPRQLADQATPEYATPIKIPIPVELRQKELRPGQLLYVIFQRADAVR